MSWPYGLMMPPSIRVLRTNSIIYTFIISLFIIYPTPINRLQWDLSASLITKRCQHSAGVFIMHLPCLYIVLKFCVEGHAWVRFSVS